MVYTQQIVCLTAFLLSQHLPLQAQIDDSGNGLSDVWENAHVIGLDPDEDSDGDSFTNRQEAAAGTDPLDPNSHPRISSLSQNPPDEFLKSWPTVAGIHYQPMVSRDLAVWQPVGFGVIGTGEEHQQILRPTDVISSGNIRRTRWQSSTYGLATVKGYAASASPPTPLIDDTLTRLEIPQSNPDLNEYAQWLRGWIIAPETGDYSFRIASDDSSEFWLSSNNDPSNKSLRSSVSGWTNPGEWEKYPSQQSAPVTLTAGQPYYFEIFHQEGGGGDHIALSWQRPSMPAGVREILSGNVLASSGETLGDLIENGERLFFRLEVKQIDSDGDGVTDYEEHLLGLNPQLATTTPRLEDAVAARRMLESPSTVTLGVAHPRAYEETGAAARFIAFRSGGIGPITVPYAVSGTADPLADFEPLPGTVHFPAGARAVAIPVFPTDDGILEPQETVTLTLLPGEAYGLGSPTEATITIDDAADILYVAQLRSASGLGSAGKGIASVRSAGNSLHSLLALSYGGLSSSETGAEIFHSTNQGLCGPTVFTYPPGQTQTLPWDFTPAGGLTREEILQALADGELWVRVNTTSVGVAEIIGQLLATPGWQTMPPVEETPPAPTHANSTGETARFLTQATFGPAEAELAALTGNAYAPWIDSQLAIPPTYHRDDVVARAAEWLARGEESGGWQAPRNEIWWQRALTAPDQLRQRMAFALSQIFVISQFGQLDIHHEGVTLYYDMLLQHSFGNYRDLIEDVTLSPMMGTYLSMMRNRKPDPVTGHEPDENYAREIKQLFSVGLSETHLDGSLRLDPEGLPIPTYTQEETVGLAHIFTGWGPHYDPADPPRWNNGTGDVANPNDWFRYGYDALREMSYYPDFHDNQERVILGGHIIPAGSDGVDRMRQALDAIFHHPNTGPFMAKQLIQKFITANPSPGYIARVASVFNDNGGGVRGDLGATLKAVLLDYEARAEAPRQSYSFGKPSEPMLRIARALRVLPGNLPIPGNPNYYINLQYAIPEQAPLLASSVFNFYQPGYSSPGPIARAGLLSPEFQIFAETNALRQANQNLNIITWGIWTNEQTTPGNVNRFSYDYAPLIAILNTPGLTPIQAQNRIIDHLDERFLFGKMSPELRSQILAAYGNLPGWFDFTDGRQQARVELALYLILNSPEFFVQK